SLRICASSLDRLNHHRLIVMFRGALEKDIGPSIDEEADIRSIGRLPRGLNPISLLDGLAELSIRGEAVLQVAAYCSRLNGQADRSADGFRCLAIAAFQIDRYRQVRHADDPTQIVNRQGTRDSLTVLEAVRIGHRPTASRDRLGAARGDGLGAA